MKFKKKFSNEIFLFLLTKIFEFEIIVKYFILLLFTINIFNFEIFYFIIDIIDKEN